MSLAIILKNSIASLLEAKNMIFITKIIYISRDAESNQKQLRGIQSRVPGQKDSRFPSDSVSATLFTLVH